jgi:hypothetical protein
MRLQDAGFREQEWAQQLIQEKKVPEGISFEDMLAHAVYDPSRDEIVLTVKAAVYTWKVERP